MIVLGFKIQFFLHYLYAIAYSWRSLLHGRGRNSLWSPVLALHCPVSTIFVWHKMQSQLSAFTTRFRTWVNVQGADLSLKCDKHATNYQAEGNPRGYICHDSSFKLAVQTKYAAEGAGTKKQNSGPRQWENKDQIKTTIGVNPQEMIWSKGMVLASPPFKLFKGYFTMHSKRVNILMLKFFNSFSF